MSRTDVDSMTLAFSQFLNQVTNEATQKSGWQVGRTLPLSYRDHGGTIPSMASGPFFLICRTGHELSARSAQGSPLQKTAPLWRAPSLQPPAIIRAMQATSLRSVLA